MPLCTDAMHLTPALLLSNTTNIRTLRAVHPKLRIYHELFGFFASSEGAPLTTHSIHTNLSPSFEIDMVPSHAATFLVPIHLSPHTTFPGDIHAPNPQMLLIRRLDISSLRISPDAHTLELYDFNTHPIPLKQTRQSLTKIEKQTVFTALAGYIQVDFGHQYAGRHPPTSSLGSLDNTRASEHTWGPSFSSYPGDTTYATNWKNPVIFLQHPTHLLPGDTILIETHVDVSTTTPHYIIHISYPTKTDTPPETIRLNMTSLYPSYHQVCTSTPRPSPGTSRLTPTDGPATLLATHYSTFYPQDLPSETTTPYTPPTPSHTTPVPQPSPPTSVTSSPARTCGGGKHFAHPASNITNSPWSTIDTNNNLLDRVLISIATNNHSHSQNDEPHTLFCPLVESLARKYLHLTQTYNTHATQTKFDEVWFSTNPTLKHIGATTTNLPAFLQNKFTWFNPYTGHQLLAHQLQVEMLTRMATAIHCSFTARAAGLTTLDQDEIRLIASRAGVRHAYIITTFPPGSVTTHTPRYDIVTTETDSHTLLTQLTLLVFETPTIPPVDTENFLRAISLRIPQARHHSPRQYKSKCVTHSHRKPSPLDFPSFGFFIHTPSIIPPPDNRSTIETHSRVAGALGILPIDFQKSMRYHQHKVTAGHIDTQMLKQIQSILRRTAIESYTAYEHYKKRRSRGLPT